MRISDWSSDVCSSDLGLGMRLVLADLDAAGLQTLCKELQAGGAQAIACVTDVGELSQVERLRDVAIEHFGGVDLLFSSEERSVGKECVSTGRSWWSPEHSKKKHSRSEQTKVNR